MKKCPKCKTSHYDGVDLCDCGYLFSLGKVTDIPSKPESKKSNGLWVAAGVMALALFAGKSMGLLAGTEAAALRNEIPALPTAAPSLKKKMMDLAEQINSSAPRMVSAETRLDRAIVGTDHTMTYLYTLPNNSSEDFDPSMYDTAKDMIRKHACGSAPLVDLLNQGATATYIYRGNDGKEIVHTDIHSADCLVKNP